MVSRICWAHHDRSCWGFQILQKWFDCLVPWACCQLLAYKFRLATALASEIMLHHEAPVYLLKPHWWKQPKWEGDLHSLPSTCPKFYLFAFNLTHTLCLLYSELDCQVVWEKKPTPEEEEKAKSLQLPPTFFCDLSTTDSDTDHDKPEDFETEIRKAQQELVHDILIGS